MTPELKKNLEVISQRFPDVFEELKNNVTTKASEDALQVYLKSVYPSENRELLFAKWVEHLPHETQRVILTPGFGDGSHVKFLLQSMPQSCRLCVLDADPSLLLTALEQTDLSELLNNPRFILLTPFAYRDVITKLNLELVGVQSAYQFLYPPIFEKNASLYKNLMGVVMRQLTIRWNQLKTDITNAATVFENSITNFARHGFGAEVMALHNAFQGKPFVLVGAGPSLDDSIDFLKAAQGRAVIAVVNSAYRAVTNAGIKPDLTVAVDPYHGTFKGYADCDTSHPYLISTYLVYPKVPSQFEGRIFPLSSYNFFMGMLRKLLNLPQEPGIVGDGTVSTTVVNIAAFMGCSTVYLVGQDMAVSTSGQIHTQDSFYTDQNANNIDLSTCTWLPGNSGKDVPVEAKLRAYLRIFENMVSGYTDIQFYNLAANGAQIHGAIYQEQSVATETILSFPEQDFHGRIREIHANAQLPPQAFETALQFLQTYLDFLETLVPILMKFAIAVEMEPRSTEIPVEQLKTLHPTLANQRTAIIEKMKERPLFFTLLAEGRTKSEYRDFIVNEEPWRMITDNVGNVAEMAPPIWALIEGCVFQIEVLQNNL